MDHINSEGVVGIGEINTRVLREALVELEFENAKVAAKVETLNGVIKFAKEHIDKAGPYDDTRSMSELIVWAGDRIREVQQ